MILPLGARSPVMAVNTVRSPHCKLIYWNEQQSITEVVWDSQPKIIATC